MLSFLILFSACDNKKIIKGNSSDKKDSTEGEIFGNSGESVNENIIYEYAGPPVAPKYHRGYIFKVHKEDIQLFILCYSDTLSRHQKKIEIKEYETIKGNIEKYYIKSCEKTENEFCAGGNTEFFEYDKNGKRIIGQRYNCGGKSYGDICGDVTGFGNSLKKYFEDFEQLIEVKE